MPKTNRQNRLAWRQKLIVKPIERSKIRMNSFLARRPHRSFRRSRRRDYARPLNLPGYLSFTVEVIKLIWQNKRLLLGATFIYALVTALTVGLAPQELYSSVGESLEIASDDMSSGSFGRLGEAGLLLMATLTGNFNGAVTPEAQIYSVILSLLFWLIIVWLLRSILAGRNIKLRDAIYNSGAPIVSTGLVLLVFIVQLLPLAVAVLVYGSGVASGILDSGVEAMLIWLAIILLIVLSLYWSVGTIIALVAVTIPGMYPFQAIKAAGDLVSGRRVRIFLRFLWLLLVNLIFWTLIVIPIIILDTMLKQAWNAAEWLPIVPIVILVMSSLTMLFTASYTYLLYRRIVDDDAKPA